MIHIWRIHMRKLSAMPSGRKPFSYLIACDSENEVDAKAYLVKHWGSDEWWAETIITELDYIGELHGFSSL